MRSKPKDICSCAPPVECPTMTTRAQCIPTTECTTAITTIRTQCNTQIPDDNFSTCEQPQPWTCAPQVYTDPCTQDDHVDQWPESERERCVVVDDCANYARESRPRLLPPVFPIKPKERRKGKKKGAGRTKTEDDETISGQVDAQTESDNRSAPTSRPIGTSSAKSTKTSGPTQSVKTTRKSTTKKPRSKTPSPKKKQDQPTGNIFFLRRPKGNGIIDWKKPPRFPVKQTVTSKLRNEYWFADCGKFRVKAYKGDWANFPAELVQDYELYENYFKYRKNTSRKKSSLVKKLVQGKIDLQKPRIEKKLFRKRSPVLRPASKSPKSTSQKSKKKVKITLGYLQNRGASFNLHKKPLIEVKQTMTTNLRNTTDTGSCKKADTPTYWHGSAEEIEQLKNKITQRKGKLRNYYKEKSESNVPDPDAKQSNPSKKSNNSDCMNNLIVISKPSTIDGEKPKIRHSSRKSRSSAKSEKIRKEKLSDETVQKSDIKSKNRRSVSAPKTAMRPPKVVPKRHRGKPSRGITGLDKFYNATKWMLPPTIPIRHSLTSTMRQNSFN